MTLISQSRSRLTVWALLPELKGICGAIEVFLSKVGESEVSLAESLLFSHRGSRGLSGPRWGRPYLNSHLSR